MATSSAGRWARPRWRRGDHGLWEPSSAARLLAPGARRSDSVACLLSEEGVSSAAARMFRKGYVYILVMEGTRSPVKVGFTSRTPEERAREISRQTGTPRELVVAASWWVM